MVADAGVPAPAGSVEPGPPPPGSPLLRGAPAELLSGRRRWGLGERGLRGLAVLATVIPVLALGLILAVLVDKALPAIAFNGFGFFTRLGWHPGNTYGVVMHSGGVAHPVGARYGAVSLVVGTLASSAIAMVIAVPLSVGAALAIVEKLPRRLSHYFGFFLELLAGIPSVVFGLWGALTFGPLLSRDVYPMIARNVPDVPVLSWFKGDVGAGEGLLTSGIVLAIMVVPIIAATTRDLLRQVPTLPKEGARALGMSDWEVTRRVSLRWIGAGIVGAAVLGLARALGETIAVAMVSGAILGTLPTNAYSTFTTIAATIVSQLDSALTDATGFYVATLAEAALVLVVITLLANVGARLLVRRVSTAGLPVGRGI